MTLNMLALRTPSLLCAGALCELAQVACCWPTEQAAAAFAAEQMLSPWGVLMCRESPSHEACSEVSALRWRPISVNVCPCIPGA